MGIEAGVASTSLSPIGAAGESAGHLLRRADLASFLRLRRDRAHLSDDEESRHERRRVRGLRREEVAERAGISGTWYTWLEQGRVINVSEDSIRRICAALDLNAVETEFAFDLLRTNEPAPFVLEPRLPFALRTIVQSYDASAAFVTGPRYDVLAWNEWTERIFGYHPGNGELERNLVWRLFNDPLRRTLFDEWERIAQTCVSDFRRNYTKYRGEAAFDALLEILRVNADFERIWSSCEILPATAALRIDVTHPIYGKLSFDATIASVNAVPGCSLVIYASAES